LAANEREKRGSFCDLGELNKVFYEYDLTGTVLTGMKVCRLLPYPSAVGAKVGSPARKRWVSDLNDVSPGGATHLKCDT